MVLEVHHLFDVTEAEEFTDTESDSFDVDVQLVASFIRAPRQVILLFIFWPSVL